MLCLTDICLGPAAAASIAAAHWPELQTLILINADLGDAGAAALVTGTWASLE